MLLCGACATRPAAVETACNWVRPIEVTGDQVAVFSDNMRIMRPLADQINAQNSIRAQKCR